MRLLRVWQRFMCLTEWEGGGGEVEPMLCFALNTPSQENLPARHLQESTQARHYKTCKRT
jgi:hypothetical protein